MTFDQKPLSPGLYFVATPIGAARDITLRTLDILASADILAAEDTRSLRRLMDIHGVPFGDRPILSYHDHNGPAMRPRLLAALAEGKSLAYASEAGTPLVADPGYQLLRAAIEGGHTVIGAPGPSAVLAALSVAGLPTDRFLFNGFLPTGGGRKRGLRELKDVPATLVFYESPKRLREMLKDCASELGGTRQAAVCRELTKRFEEISRGTLDDLVAEYDDRPIKGEIVVVIDRNRAEVTEDTMFEALDEALKTMRVKDAASHVAEALGLPRRQVYQAALSRGQDRDA